MLRSVCFTLIFILGFAILGCKNKSLNPGIKPEAVQLIPHGPDRDWIERGIDADSETDGIYLAWYPPEEDDIAYVEIYRRADDITDFQNLSKVFSPDTSYIDTKVDFHKQYFYFALSVNEDGLSSVSSDTLVYTLLEKAVDLLPSGSIDSQTPQFSWRDPNQVNFYILKLFEAATETPVWISTVESNYSERMEIEYNFDKGAQIPALKRGTDYLWRVDVIINLQNPSSGSESQWTSFNIP